MQHERHPVGAPGQFGPGPDGGRAARLELGQQPALGGHPHARGQVVEGGDRGGGLLVVGPALDGERALRGRREHGLDVEALRGALSPADPVESGGGEHHGVELARLDEAHAGVDVAADGPQVEVGPAGEELRATPRRGGADARALGKGVERQAVPRDEHVRGVDARRHGDLGEAVVGRGGQVLVRVHGDVALAAVERVAQRLREHADADPLDGRHVHVAGGANDHELGGVPGRDERVAHVPRLRGGQGAAAGTDAQDATVTGVGRGHRSPPGVARSRSNSSRTTSA